MESIKIASIIVPAFNESDSLKELYERTKGVLDQQKQAFEFIVIDDGSTDDTYNVLRAMREQYKNIGVVRHLRNHGKSLALTQGFSFANGDIAITMDADLQDQPEMIPLFISKINEGQDMVNGWRLKREDSFLKNLFSKCFNFIISIIFDTKIHDINCGMKAYKRDLYKSLQLRGDLHRFIPIIARQRGYKITEIPVIHAKRKYGKSKYALTRFVGLLDVISVITYSATQTRPFHVFSKAAIILNIMTLPVFIGWLLIGELPMTNAFICRLMQKLLLFFAIWLVLFGTSLPLFGLILENIAAIIQDEKWREKLIKDKVYPQNT